MSNDNSRITFFSIVAFIALGALVVRVAYLQLYEGKFYTEYAAKQAEGVIESTKGRGYIMDVNGDPLALNKKCASLYVFAGELKHRKLFVRKLKQAGISPSKATIRRILKNNGFVWIDRNMDISKAEMIKKKLPKVDYILEEQRLYPERKMAASIIGFTGTDNKGLSGMEYQYNKILKGHKFRLLGLRDNRGNRIIFTDAKKKEEIHTYLYLTIDKYLQGLAEDLLREDTARFKAKRGIAIAMDVYSGDIILAASSGGFDANDYSDYPKKEWKNYPAGFLYEPGSIFKPVLFSLLLDREHLDTKKLVNCENGRYYLYGHEIHDVHPYKILTARQILVKSSNIGTMKLSKMVTKKEFHDYVSKCGFGHRTGIQGTGEEEGILRDVKEWSGLSKPSISIGQEVMVTPLQMVRFYSAIANGGELIKPTIVSKVETGGHTYKPKFHEKRLFSEQTARKLQSLLRDVVTDGTGVHAQSDFLKIAGKTGTGQRINKETGTYSNREYVASFAGFFPADNPRIAMVVLYKAPRTSIYGGSTAAYTFRTLAEQIAMHLGIKRRYVYESLPAS